MVINLCKQPQILGAKISGAGLGDCVVGLGLSETPYAYTHTEAIMPLQVAMSLQGVCCEKI